MKNRIRQQINNGMLHQPVLQYVAKIYILVHWLKVHMNLGDGWDPSP